MPPAAQDNALAKLAAAFSDDDDDADATPVVGSGAAVAGDGRTLAQCKQDQKDNCLTEPTSGLRYRWAHLASLCARLWRAGRDACSATP